MFSDTKRLSTSSSEPLNENVGAKFERKDTLRAVHPGSNLDRSAGILQFVKFGKSVL